MPPPREFRDPIPPLSGPLPPARLADPCFNTHKRQNRSSAAASGGGTGGEERIERAREIQRSLEQRMERRKSQYEDVVANHNQVRKDAGEWRGLFSWMGWTNFFLFPIFTLKPLMIG